MSSIIDLNPAYRGALARWQNPSPAFASGYDPRTSDWWDRRVFDEWLRKGVPGHPGDSELWGCDDAGRLTAVGDARH